VVVEIRGMKKRVDHESGPPILSLDFILGHHGNFAHAGHSHLQLVLCPMLELICRLEMPGQARGRLPRLHRLLNPAFLKIVQ
jgi:hypothetical protein